MKRVTGIGGIFFKSKDPKGIKEWYRKHLGNNPALDGELYFQWRAAQDPNKTGVTVWGPFSADTKYFDPSTSTFMINYRVANLTQLLETLRKEGVHVEDKVEEYEYGKFGWIMDPDGNKIELWEPPAENMWNDGIPMR